MTRRDDTRPTPGSDRERTGAALALLCSAQFLVVLDTTVVSVALPSIGADLGFGSRAGLQYVLSIYALAISGTLVLTGRLADLVGRRRLFATGLATFTVASVSCGLAPTPVALLAARAVQGVGGAMVSSAGLALLTACFREGAARNRALGAWGATGGAAGASGLIVGGALTGTLGWPWVFFVNVPLGLLATTAARWVLPPDYRSGGGWRRLDLPGACAVTAGLALLALGLGRAEQGGFTDSATLILLVSAAALLGLLVPLQRRVANPLLPARLFRTPGVTGANVVGLLVTSVVASNLFFTTLYVQQVLGFSPLVTGIAFLPNSALVVAGSAMASRLVARFRPRPLLTAGLLTLALGALLLSAVSAQGSYLADVLPGFAVTGLGLGLAIVPVTLAATRGVAEHDRGLASGVVNTAQQTGFAVGLAAVVAVAFGHSPAGDLAVESMVAGFATGYRLDVAIAVVGAVLAAGGAAGRSAAGR